MTTVGVYARISDDRAGSGLGVTRQETDCRHLAETRGWTVADVYIDNDTSAYRGRRRPNYQRLLDDLKTGRIGGVVAWHPDRLHRSPKELEAFIDVIDASGAVVATVQAGDLDLSTASGRMTARIVGAVSRHESEHKSERHRRKHLELAAAGKTNGGGWRPFGYEPDRLTIRPDEAAIIRELAERVLSGDSIRGLLADLNRRGIATTTGKPWGTSTMRRLLMSPRIAGLREHRGEIAAPAVWPAIIDRATSEALRRLLSDPARRLNRNPRSYLLTGGLAFCALCDRKLVARPRADKRRCYVCASGPGFGGCGKIRVVADPLERYVVDVVLEGLEGGALTALLERRSERPAASTVDLAEVEGQLDELATMFAAAEIGRREWLVARRHLEDRRERLAAVLADQARGSALTPLMGGAGTLAERWGAMGFGQQRAALAAVLDRVVVGPAVKGRNFFDPGRVQPPRGDVVWRA